MPQSLKKFLAWKFIGILVGGIAGAILGGNLIVRASNPENAWKAIFPAEGIIGAIGGILLGGALAGGRIGLFGASLLIGTATGLLLGYLIQPHYKVGLFVWGAIFGLFIGVVVGVFLEIKFSRNG